MAKPLFLFVGKSASGKTSVANMLESDGYTQIASYTTRPPRYENEVGHTFISEDEYAHLQNIMASTLYNGYHYCTTLEQINNANIYVLDPPGVETLLHNYNTINRSLFLIYFDSNICNRIKRMLERGDSDTQIVGRLLNDEADGWIEQVQKICLSYPGLVQIISIDANKSLQDVYTEVKSIIDKMESGTK